MRPSLWRACRVADDRLHDGGNLLALPSNQDDAGFRHDRVGQSDFLALGAGVIDRNTESLRDRRQCLFGPLALGTGG